MKGIVFTGLLEMVEQRFGYVVANNIIVQNELPSGGVYTGVGTYDHKELFLIVGRLSEQTGLPPSQLFEAFGEYYFSQLAEKAAKMIDLTKGLIFFLARVEHYIHPEVLKLYPDAQLPTFQIVSQSDTELKMLYQSKRRMEHFALGLMKGAIVYFNEPYNILMELQADGDTLFTITKTVPHG